MKSTILIFIFQIIIIFGILADFFSLFRYARELSFINFLVIFIFYFFIFFQYKVFNIFIINSFKVQRAVGVKILVLFLKIILNFIKVQCKLVIIIRVICISVIRKILCGLILKILCGLIRKILRGLMLKILCRVIFRSKVMRNKEDLVIIGDKIRVILFVLVRQIYLLCFLLSKKSISACLGRYLYFAFQICLLQNNFFIAVCRRVCIKKIINLSLHALEVVIVLIDMKIKIMAFKVLLNQRVSKLVFIRGRGSIILRAFVFIFFRIFCLFIVVNFFLRRSAFMLRCAFLLKILALSKSKVTKVI